MKEELFRSRLLAGDEEAIGWCIRKYSRLLWPIAWAVLHHVGSDADVEECVADVFISLWEKPAQFDPRRGSLKTYLCTLTRSRAIDRYRQIVRRNTVPLEEALLAEEFGMETAMVQQQTRQELAMAVQNLSHPGQEILVRRYYYGQKPKEIALALGMTTKQVDNALYRVKRQLREVLAERGGEV